MTADGPEVYEVPTSPTVPPPSVKDAGLRQRVETLKSSRMLDEIMVAMAQQGATSIACAAVTGMDDTGARFITHAHDEGFALDECVVTHEKRVDEERAETQEREAELVPEGD